MMYVEHEVGHDFIAEQDITHKVEKKDQQARSICLRASCSTTVA